MKTLESFLTDCVGSSDGFTKTKCDTKHQKYNYNNNNNNNLGDLQKHLQTSSQLQQIQNEQQTQQNLKFEASTRHALNAESVASVEATNTTIEDNQNLSFTRWWFMLMQQTINYNYNNILQRPNAAATTTTLPAAFLDELLGNVANIFSSE